MENIQTFSTSSWHEQFSETFQNESIKALENGQVLFFPQLAFQLTTQEQQFLSPDFISAKAKNISFNKKTNAVRGLADQVSKEQHQALHGLFERFVQHAQLFINNLFPHYTNALVIGRTSFRPVEVDGRVTSYRKDDTRLHVDAFPASPNHGWRLLRVFCNINPHGQKRVWRLGETFPEVAQRFLPRLNKPVPGSASVLHWLGITKQRRTLYDHYMLQLHNNMKADEVYQRQARQQEFHFPANSSWIVQTDQVSHAAMSGQYLLEQTFYLPVEAMEDEQKSPLRTLESLIGRRLV